MRLLFFLRGHGKKIFDFVMSCDHVVTKRLSKQARFAPDLSTCSRNLSAQSVSLGLNPGKSEFAAATDTAARAQQARKTLS